MDESRPRRRYHRPGEAVWRAVRVAYLEGETMAACAERFGVSVEAIKNRVWRDGWSKRDYAAAAASAPLERAPDPAGFAPRRDSRPPPPLWLPPDYAPSGPGESGAPRSGSKGSRRAGDQAGPTWFRLTEEAWDLIREEYLDGATAKALAARWRVGAGSIYRRASAEGWTKDSRAALIVEEVAARDAVERELAEYRRTMAALRRLEAQAAAPPTPGALAKAAFADAACAFAEGRTEDALRLLRLAGQALRTPADVVAPAGAAAPRRVAEQRG